MPAEGPFHRPVVKNNWEYLTYTWNDLSLDEKLGGTCSVRWADGSVEHDVPFYAHTESHSYSDHGRETRGQHYELRAAVSLNGVPIQIPLEKLELANIAQDGRVPPNKTG
jgi:hypothetical protein